MRENKKLLIVITLIILGLLFLLYPRKEKKFKTVELSELNIVYNKTNMKYLDTITRIGLDILGEEFKSVLIRELPSTVIERELKNNNIILKAVIIPYPDYFIIYIDDVSKVESINVIAHELIHLSQYSSGKLNIDNSKYIIWEKDTFPLPFTIDYIDRPWEEDARDNAKALAYEIKKVLLE